MKKLMSALEEREKELILWISEAESQPYKRTLTARADEIRGIMRQVLLLAE